MGLGNCRNLILSRPLVLILSAALLLVMVVYSGATQAATTIAVNTTDDELNNDGDCSLREAIEAANIDSAVDACPAGSGTDTISFNIPGAGPYTIQPVSALPTITDPVVIDGYTQSGASANTNGQGTGSNAVLKIELDGSSAGSPVNGLHITAGGSTVKGLVINRFAGTFPNTGNGIRLATGGSNIVEGNFIGTDVTGTADLGNAANGVYVRNSPSNTIGGTTLALALEGMIRGATI